MKPTSVPLTVLALTLVVGASSARAAFEVERVPAAGGRAATILAPRDLDEAVVILRFAVGSFDDDQLYGLTRLTQRALLEANGALGPAYLEDLYAGHATVGLRTDVRTASFVLNAPRSEIDALAKELLQGVLRPRLDGASFDRARRLTLDDQTFGSGLDDYLGMLAGEVLLTAVSEGGGDYRNPPLGDRRSVRELDLGTVSRHAGRYFVPANLTVIATGGFDAKKLKKLVTSLKGGKPNVHPPVEAAALPREFERYSPREAHFHAQVLELDTAERVAAARILDALVWDRLMWRLRRKGVTYTPITHVASREWLDVLVILVYVSSSRERGVRVEPLIREYLDQLLVDVPDEDYLRNKDFVLRSMRDHDENAAALASVLGETPFRVSLHGQEVADAVDGMQKARFLEIIRGWLGPERSVNFLFGRSRAQYKRNP